MVFITFISFQSLNNLSNLLNLVRYFAGFFLTVLRLLLGFLVIFTFSWLYSTAERTRLFSERTLILSPS